MKMEFREIPVPGELDQVVTESLKKITVQQKKRNLKLWAFRGGAVAAAFVCGIVFCISNPSFAANLPLIGHIFEKMQDDFPYAGDYSGIGEKLADEPASGEEGAEETTGWEEASGYVQTVDGVTITLSEMYCNSQALYVTVQIQSEEKFPEIDSLNFEESTGEFSFLVEEAAGKSGFRAGKAYLTPTLDGAFIDENTYAGLLRFDLNEVTGYNASALEIPETYSVKLRLNRLVGGLVDVEAPDFGLTEEEMEAMSDEEWKAWMLKWDAEHPDYDDHLVATYCGSWIFDLDVTMDKSDMQVVEINEKNEQGIGFKRVVKDRFEITMYTYPDISKDSAKHYFPVMLDADGKLMDGNDGWVNVLEIGDHDVSTVDLFLVNELLWLDELKGIYWDNPEAETYNGKTFKEILLENCAYHKEISFETE
ncbi:MAG: DUF4179 domain-containing protein [Bacteroidales bacterium]|nr:DUF4179 domain-containing protein [Clostridium sp.]MCM1204574.1 DUF4179 domain-containing protein [Bacteroidales bacterium]